MEKSSMNIILFDEQSSYLQEHSFFRRQNSQTNLMQSQIISKEIQTLNEKLVTLQKHTQLLTKEISYKKTQTTIAQSKHNSYYDDLLQIVQRKIQTIIKQTQKIVKKMVQNFEKKLRQKENKQKMLADNQPYERLKQTVRKIEFHYQNQLDTLKQQNIATQNDMYQKMNFIQEQFAKKIISFQRKQRNYADKIEQLELKLKQRSKKMIEVTQDRSFSRKNIQENNSKSINNILPTNISPHKDTSTSKIRRHKIFQLKGQNRSSVSPVKIVSPIASNNSKPYQQSSQFNFNSNHQIYQTNTYRQSQPIKNNYLYPRTESEKQMLPLCSQSPKKQVKREQTTNYIPSASQFYNNLPKANTGGYLGWKKFEDFKDDGGSDSQEDVFFYPENHSQQSSQKILSPLDLN